MNGQNRPDGSYVEATTVLVNGAYRVSGDQLIVGAWRYRHYTGATAFERYTPDGRMLFRLSMRSTTGCYEIAGDRISFASPVHKAKKEATFEARSGELVLKDPRKPVAVYTRDEAGPWYDREHITIRSRNKN